MVNVDRYLDSGLVDSVKRSMESVDHLSDADEGAVAAALQLAQMIETQAQNDELSSDAMKTLNTSYQVLQRYLTDLGLTPQGRKNLGLDSGDDEQDGW
ncbi:terminase small subunit [Corynebacterium glutamicum]|uniref:Terminase small subunit actinomycetes phage-type domain-containing protein n=2 Tax=Corynebacterium glutamicum TaxID=1718 RepID=Q5KRF5_CORGT|nr:hypothetical protein [Corynebacterium glutamicum]BAD84099.1 hypothetical protein [Corynebacterium glutamicum]BAF54891.1 hypothetical protein cgR_1896 [Corynebacterium glutamicum R]